jgi:hypothetical protein
MSTSAERMARLRQRQREALQADPDAVRLRDAADLITPAIRQTVAELGLDGRDAGLAAMAVRLGQVLDEARDQAAALRHLGPVLLAALEAMNATPLSRAKAEPGKPDPPRDWRSEIRRTQRSV